MAGNPARDGAPGPHAQTHRFGRDRRVRRRSEFDRAFTTGSRFHGRYLTLVIGANGGGPSRLGLVASRKIGNAVARNLAKRLIREVFRKSVPRESGAAVDVVVIPRREFFDADFVALENDFRSVLRRSIRRPPRNAG